MAEKQKLNTHLAILYAIAFALTVTNVILMLMIGDVRDSIPRTIDPNVYDNQIVGRLVITSRDGRTKMILNTDDKDGASIGLFAPSSAHAVTMLASDSASGLSIRSEDLNGAERHMMISETNIMAETQKRGLHVLLESR